MIFWSAHLLVAVCISQNFICSMNFRNTVEPAIYKFQDESIPAPRKSIK